MKMKNLLAVSVILAAQFTFAQTAAPAAARRSSPPPSAQQMSETDSQKAFEVLFSADVVQEYAAAEYAKAKDIICSLDKVQLVHYGLSEAAATSCTFKKESGEEVRISGSEAMKLKEILISNNCQVEENGAHATVQAQEIEVNHDRLQQSVSGSIKK